MTLGEARIQWAALCNPVPRSEYHTEMDFTRECRKVILASSSCCPECALIFAASFPEDTVLIL